MAKTRYILGIQSYANHDTAASIVKFSDDGKILEYVAISEERLIRVKYPYVFPVHSIGYCMDYFGLKDLEQIDLLVSDYIRIKRWFNSGPTYNISDYDYLKLKFNFDPKKIRIITHHMAHAASAYYASGFDEAAILIVDGNGSDLETTSYFRGKGFEIDFLENYKYHGIGACYTAITKQILNLGTGGEGKTIGLAPYGEKHSPVLKIDAKLSGIKNDFSQFMRRLPYSDVLNQTHPKSRINPLRGHYPARQDKKDLLNPYYSRIAYDLQQETERVLKHLAKDLRSKTGSKNICVAGGVGLNSVSNKIILDKCGFENIFVFPACSDSGIPFGLALWGYYNSRELGDFPKAKLVFNNAYIGREYSSEETREVLEKYKLPYRKTTLPRVAQYLADGKIVGWVQGGSEYGPRALGHRSILADSRRAEMKDILNARVKHRESFRPFAPAVLAEHSSEYFEFGCESPYMLLIAKVKKPEAVPAITHVDNTARVQTVTREANGVFYDLIKEFQKLTGIPCILNTSFNDAGEPIVETPEDAILCFLKAEMDYLVLGEYLLDREQVQNRAEIIKRMEADRTHAIRTRRAELLQKHFPSYNEDERDYFIAESNKISEWYTKYKCKYELEKKVLQWLEEDAKILIVGTREHTAILPKVINGFNLLHIVGFAAYGDGKEFPERDEQPKLPYREYAWDNLRQLPCDVILISSHEFNFEILEELEKQQSGKQIYPIYDSTSRSFLDTLEVLPIFRT